MAISKLGTDVNTTGNTLPGTLTVSHTLVAGVSRKVLVYVAFENGNTSDVSGVTYGGVAMTKAISDITGTSGFRSYASIWYLDEANLPANGANNAVATFTGTSSTPETQMYVAEYGGIGQGAPRSGDSDGSITTTSATITNSPLNAISSIRWAFSCMQSGNAGAGGFTHGESQTQIWGFNDASSYVACTELRGGANNTSLSSTWSGTLNRTVRVAAVWNPAPSTSICIGSAWKNVNLSYVYTGGAWKPIVDGWIYTGGAWKAIAG